TALPSASTRLSFPLDYWNGLGIFVAFAFPLLAHSALSGDRARRAIALAAVPLLGAVVYLTSSRGAVAALVGGLVVFVVAQPRRWRALLEWSPRIRAAAIVLVALVVAGVAYGAVRTLERFTRLPGGDAGGEHLFSGGGSGRWQFWMAALHEFESSPLHGR